MVTLLKKFFESLLEEKAPGPSPSFSIFHLTKAFELITEEGPMGRGKLSTALKIGEGATRTLLNRLKDAGLIRVSKQGCFLTKRGEKIWKKYRSVFPQKVRLGKSELTLNAFNVAVRVKGCGDKVMAGVEQRDAAVKAGAKGATTLIFKDKRVMVPAISEDAALDFPVAYRQIAGQLELKENDVIVIGCADSWDKAEHGALAAAWTLTEDDCG